MKTWWIDFRRASDPPHRNTPILDEVLDGCDIAFYEDGILTTSYKISARRKYEAEELATYMDQDLDRRLRALGVLEHVDVAQVIG